MTQIHDWQKKLLVDIESGGLKPGEMFVMMSGRKVGKSIMSSSAFQRLWQDIMDRPVEALICNVQRVNGARFYTVEPQGGSWMEMEVWCTRTFGEPGELWPAKDFNWLEGMRWAMNNRKFWFRNEKDRDWFVIRWNA